MKQFLMAVAMVITTISSFGATIVVPTDQPTIAAAIAAATTLDQIEIAPGTYTESGLTIIQDVTIRAQDWGDPADHIIQADATPGSATDRIFTITNGRVTLQGLTLRYGNVTGDGGAIHCSGASTILSISECIITDNNANSGSGGGIYSDQAKTDFWDCVISGNTASANGGGFYINSGDTNFSQATVSGNQSTNGGGLYIRDCGAWITDCTIAGNTATANGGGIMIDLPVVGVTYHMSNSTISGNNAGLGGGIYSNMAFGNATLRHLTIAANTASTSGGGIYSVTPLAVPPQLQACIVADNMAASGPDIFGEIDSYDYNLIEDVTDMTIFGTTTNNVTGVDPNLGPLADNGGQTMTHALLPGSPALDQIPDADLLETWDQRQAPRSQNVDSDIGAYELFVDDWGATMINMWQQPPPDNDTITVMVSFDQLAINFDDVSDLIITTTGTLAFTDVTGFMGGMNFSVTLEGVTGTGTITIAVDPASDVVTPFGAPLTTSVTSDVFFSDNDPPTISISAPNPANTVSGPVEYIVTYTDADTVTLDETDITLNTTGDVMASVVVADLGGGQWSVTLLGITGEGSLGFTIAPGTASDTTGNLADGATATPATVGQPMPVAAWPALLALAAAGVIAAYRKQKK